MKYYEASSHLWQWVHLMYKLDILAEPTTITLGPDTREFVGSHSKYFWNVYP